MPLAVSPQAVDLREYFKVVLNQSGVWAVFTRSDHRFRCRDCFNPTTRDARISCSNCFGTGYNVTLERWRVTVTQTLFRSRSLGAPLIETGWGSQHEPVVFSRWEDIPEIGDRFFFVEWDQDVERNPYGAQPTKISEIFIVTYREPEYAAGGMIYNASHGELITDSVRVVLPALLKTPIDITRFVD